VILRAGEGGYGEYRIPGVIATPKGLVMCCEARKSPGSDWGKIDVLILREDGVRFLIEGSETDTVNNPTLIADGERTHLIYHLNYARAFHRVSRDFGVTWSEPSEITKTFREFPYEWNVCATGPGHGVRLSTGRLVAPVWFANGRVHEGSQYVADHHPSVAGTIYSDDGGATWRAGALFEGLVDGNETSCAELPNGRVLFNIRHRGEARRRALALSDDGGETSGVARYEDALPDPMCFGSMIRAGGDLYFVNCDSERGRVKLTVKKLNGDKWTPAFHVDELGGYADIAFDGERLCVFYERGACGRITELRLVRL
jgi:sialidase-1